jgi:hypothetical protein
MQKACEHEQTMLDVFPRHSVDASKVSQGFGDRELLDQRQLLLSEQDITHKHQQNHQTTRREF